jgi:hypothetical protein
MIEDIKLKERGMDKDQLLFNAGASTKWYHQLCIWDLR